MKSKEADYILPTMASAPSLYDFLRDADLLSYHDKLKNVLKLRHAGDLAFCEEKDLTRVGMSRPEQKRLRFEYGRRFPGSANSKQFANASTSHSAAASTASSSSLVVKLRKKVFGGGGQRDSAPSSSASDAALNDDAYQTESAAPRSTSSMSPRGWSAAEQHVIPAENISLCKELGKGEFGCVYQAAWHYSQSGDGGYSDDVLQVAVKRVLPEKLVSNPASFLQEATIMTRMRHPNVIRLFGVVLDTKAVMLVSELAPCGSLLECLQCPAWREPFPVDALCDFALQIGQGMRYLANQRLIHRDLAARNVLVSSPTKVKISDFGLSRSLGVGEDYYRSEFSASMRLPVAWCAPESIKFLRFTSASDVWAYGVTLWEMFSYGKVPWANMTGTQMLMAVDAERRVLEWPDACPDEFYALMRDCWAYDADVRPTFDAICERLPDHMPQLLMTVADSRHGADWNYLPYKRGDILVLLRKCPPSSLSGSGRSESRASCRSSATAAERDNLWFGALKRGGGLVGLFPPEETVAYLGAEYPAQSMCLTGPSSLASSVTSLAQNGKTKNISGKTDAKCNPNSTNSANGKKSVLSKIIRHENAEKSRALGGLSAESDNERRKLLISQPQGDLRHTGHLGPDGQGFGLVNLDKRELAKPLSPTPTAHNAIPSATLPPQSLFVNTAAGAPQPASTHGQSNASASTMDAVAPPRPPTARPRQHISSRSTAEASENGTPEERLRIVSPPILPPRTYKNSEKYTSKNTDAEIPDIDATELDEHLMILKAEAQRSLPMFSACPKSAAASGTHNDPFYSPTPNARDEFVDRELPSAIRYDNSATDAQDESAVCALNLDRVLNELQRDISDFSLTTIVDYSDTRPLLQNVKFPATTRKTKDELKCAEAENVVRTNESSMVRGMTPEECEKWRERVNSAHKKAAKSLARELDGQRKVSPDSQQLDAEKFHAELERLKAAGGGVLCCGASTLEKSSSTATSEGQERLVASKGTFTAKFLSKAPIEEGWSEEAQAAYKLLVQFGDKLKSTNAHDGGCASNGAVKQNGRADYALRFANGRAENLVESDSRKDIEYINPCIMDAGANEDFDGVSGTAEKKKSQLISATKASIINNMTAERADKSSLASSKVANKGNVCNTDGSQQLIESQNSTDVSQSSHNDASKTQRSTDISKGIEHYSNTSKTAAESMDPLLGTRFVVNGADLLPEQYANRTDGVNADYVNSCEQTDSVQMGQSDPGTPAAATAGEHLTAAPLRARSDYAVQALSDETKKLETLVSNTLPHSASRLPPTVPPKPKRSVPNLYEN